MITSSARGLAAEVAIDHRAVGLDRESVVDCDGLHAVARTTLTELVGGVDAPTSARVCAARRARLLTGSRGSVAGRLEALVV